MPIKKRRRAQAAPANYRAWRSQLKSAGLFGKKVSLRGPVTAAQKRTIAKYKDVLSGKAKLLDTGSDASARKFRSTYGLSGRGSKVIVPKAKGERITFSKKTAAIKIKKGRETKVLEENFGAGPAVPGTRLFYTLEFNRGADTEKYRFESFDELLSFMMPYEKDKAGPPKRKGWKSWRRYVYKEYLDNETIKEERDEGVNIKTARKSASKARRKK